MHQTTAETALLAPVDDWPDHVREVAEELLSIVREAYDYRDLHMMLVEPALEGRHARIWAHAGVEVRADIAERGQHSPVRDATTSVRAAVLEFAGIKNRDLAQEVADLVSMWVELQMHLIASVDVDAPAAMAVAMASELRGVVTSINTPRTVAEGILGIVGVEAGVLVALAAGEWKTRLHHKRRRWLLESLKTNVGAAFRYASCFGDQGVLARVPEEYRVSPLALGIEYVERLETVSILASLPVEDADLA